jgi:predicted nucleic acid-binding protein
MFILDTNVLSTVIGAQPAPPVAAWVLAQPTRLLFTASVCQAEILAGIAVMPHGRRRENLETAARAMFENDFAERVLPFDREAAIAYGDLFGARRRAGRPGSTPDLMIASIARAKAARVVTRDIGDFEHCGLTVIDPWTAVVNARNFVLLE